MFFFAAQSMAEQRQASDAPPTASVVAVSNPTTSPTPNVVEVAPGVQNADQANQPNANKINQPNPNDSVEAVQEEGVAKGGNNRTFSEWWAHYDRLTVGGVKKAKCKYCKRLMMGEPKHGTSHLKKHYNRCPKRTCTDLSCCGRFKLL
ncbi:unnamed protein product [Linum trigynum]|uniref:BED-type domain-containing protein n=2 Tax=Linum trigynum TaxID=586398 RepID=A0AAV2FF69_9ROSI